MNNEYINNPGVAYRTCRIGSECRDHSEEFNMPDYIPDIRRVAFSDVTAEVIKTSGGADRIGWECILTYTALLLGNDDTLKSVTLQSRVDGELKTEGNPENARLEVKLENAGIRATDPRRMTGRSRVCVYAYSTNEISTDPSSAADTEVWCHVEKKCTQTDHAVTEMISRRDLRVSEDIELDSSMPEIADIVYCDVRPVVTATQVKDGHAEVRGEAVADICYSDVNGEYYTHQHRIPLSVIFDAGRDIVYGCITHARIGEIKAAAQSNAYGENKVVELDFSWSADVCCALERRCEVICDLYSTMHDIAAKKQEITLDKFVGAFTGNLSVSKEVSFEDLSLSNAEGVAVCRSCARINEVRRAENGRIVMHGQIDSSVVCFTGGEKEGYESCEIKIPFKYERDIDPERDDFNCIYEAAVTSLKARLERTGIRLDCELVMSALVTAPFTEQGIAEVEVRGVLENDRAPITLCFNSAGDGLWDIAKRYNVTGAEILERNGITEDELASKRVLVIPSARPSPGFSKVI